MFKRPTTPAAPAPPARSERFDTAASKYPFNDLIVSRDSALLSRHVGDTSALVQWSSARAQRTGTQTCPAHCVICGLVSRLALARAAPLSWHQCLPRIYYTVSRIDLKQQAAPSSVNDRRREAAGSRAPGAGMEEPGLGELLGIR
ncbi:hypothetical protein NDU88_006512 [Pleurodeles waltl]|uniref:Uncharacterized protein n=1 Tax=Pleurodeles waltl TaxID=8319 RepID=A0AAV7QKZ0_PLEWA|nr:hypothetical protein NDU88_006512 [Pleurodeles waltl]